MKPPAIPLEKLRELGDPCLARTIPEEWADVNGHMNMRWYVALFDDAADELYLRIGLTPVYHREHTTGTFDLEHHTHFLNECLPGDRVTVYIRMLDCSAKRLHYVAFLVNETHQKLASIFECVNGMVDLRVRRTMAYPREIREQIEASIRSFDWPPPECGVMHS